MPALIAGRELSFLHAAVYGNAAVAGGWLARARSLADEAGDCLEAGWVALAEALASDDPDERDAHVREAAAVAHHYDDPDLRFCARGYEGAGLVLRGRIREGCAGSTRRPRRQPGERSATTSSSARSTARCCSAASWLWTCAARSSGWRWRRRSAAGPTTSGCRPSAACTTAES